MVKHTVYYNLDIHLMSCFHKFPEILIISKTSVHHSVILCIIAVGCRLKQRPNINRRTSQLLNMRQPLHQVFKPVNYLPTFVPSWRSCHANGIHVIKNCLFKPSVHYAALLIADAFWGSAVIYSYYTQITEGLQLDFVIEKTAKQNSENLHYKNHCPGLIEIFCFILPNPGLLPPYWESMEQPPVWKQQSRRP